MSLVDISIRWGNESSIVLCPVFERLEKYENVGLFGSVIYHWKGCFVLVM